MKTKFLSACLGVAVVLFALGFLIRSVQPAQAAPTPEMFVEGGTNKIGKYMMLMSPETANYYESVLIWDTETGSSIRYSRKASGYEKATQQLPAAPM